MFWTEQDRSGRNFSHRGRSWVEAVEGRRVALHGRQGADRTKRMRYRGPRLGCF